MRISFTQARQLGIAGLLSIIFIGASVAVASLFYTVDTIHHRYNVQELKAQKFAQIALKFCQSGSDFYKHRDNEHFESRELIANLNVIRGIIAELRQIELTQTEQEAIAKLATGEKHFRTAVYAYKEAKRDDPASDYSAKMMAEIEHVVSEVVDFASTHSHAVEVAIRQKDKRLARGLNRIAVGLALDTGIAVCTGIFVGIGLTRALSRHIGNILHATQELGRGNLSHRINSPFTDEVGQLAIGIDEMAERLEAYEQELQTTLQNLREAKRVSESQAVELLARSQELQREVSERQRAEEQLRQAQKMEAVGTLAGGIAHDFNNILTAMLGYTELTMYDIPQDSLPWTNLQEVLVAGTRAKDLVQQILAFSRQSRAERKPIHLHLLVKEALRLLRASLPTTITICEDISKDAGAVLADPTQIHQVLLNLCVNAEHAMREAGGVLEVQLGTVEVDAGFTADHPELRPGPHLLLCVRDTGHGMTPEVMERIFEPFFTTKEVGQGTGMGLAVIHGIVAYHGGAITVESTPGKGTTVAIYLPRIDPATANEVFPQEPVPQGTERILFIDDEDALARLGQGMLERLGYDVVIHTNSLEALEAFRETPHSFDVVITDQTMPHMTGERLVQGLRRIHPDIPIILCTGFSHLMDVEKAKAIGIDAFLMKPLGLRDLGLAIRQVLERQTLEVI